MEFNDWQCEENASSKGWVSDVNVVGGNKLIWRTLCSNDIIPTNTI